MACALGYWKRAGKGLEWVSTTTLAFPQQFSGLNPFFGHCYHRHCSELIES